MAGQISHRPLFWGMIPCAAGGIPDILDRGHI